MDFKMLSCTQMDSGQFVECSPVIAAKFWVWFWACLFFFLFCFTSIKPMNNISLRGVLLNGSPRILKALNS